MPRYATADGKGTNDATAALQANGQSGRQRPRNIWVTETALTTALNTSYMAEQLALFGIVVGVALLLSGFGFAILAIGGALRNPETALTWFARKPSNRSRSPPPSAPSTTRLGEGRESGPLLLLDHSRTQHFDCRYSPREARPGHP